MDVLVAQLVLLNLVLGGFAASCSFRSQEESYTRQDPGLIIGILALHGNVEEGNEVGSTTRSCEVNRASVEADHTLIILLNGRHMDSRQLGGELLKDHLAEISLFTVAAAFPTSTFKSQTVNIGASLGKFRDLSNVKVVGNISFQAHFIKRLSSGTGSDLHSSSKEGHGVEETGDPEHSGSDEFIRPLSQLVASSFEVFKPVEQVLLGEVSNRLPGSWDLVQVQCSRKALHGISDVKSTLQTGVKIHKCTLDHAEKFIHSLALLEAHNNEGRSFSGSVKQVKHLEVLGSLIHELVNQFLYFAATTGSSTAGTTLNLHDVFKQTVSKIG